MQRLPVRVVPAWGPSMRTVWALLEVAEVSSHILRVSDSVHVGMTTIVSPNLDKLRYALSCAQMLMLLSTSFTL